MVIEISSGNIVTLVLPMRDAYQGEKAITNFMLLTGHRDLQW
jgi:hypothetical protein